MSMKYEFHNIYGDKDKPVFNLCDMYDSTVFCLKFPVG